ncbi:MAG TPA: type I restriction enzyme HsdR N-terminal domain-containing protein [Bacteroidales bacterium]|nr:type I restriction enzyme HsdR N-terminal domain-containing protein [Bacteroidales bacterium]
MLDLKSSLSLKVVNEQVKVFDIIRKKYVAFTPEEYVRQTLIRFLIKTKKYPKNLMSLEYEFKLYEQKKRADIVVYNNEGNPVMIIECKAPGIKITQNVVNQIAVYNIYYKVKYLLITNGTDFYVFFLDKKHNTIKSLKTIPMYADLT